MAQVETTMQPTPGGAHSWMLPSIHPVPSNAQPKRNIVIINDRFEIRDIYLYGWSTDNPAIATWRATIVPNEDRPMQGMYAFEINGHPFEVFVAAPKQVLSESDSDQDPYLRIIELAPVDSDDYVCETLTPTGIPNEQLGLYPNDLSLTVSIRGRINDTPNIEERYACGFWDGSLTTQLHLSAREYYDAEEFSDSNERPDTC